MGEKFLTHAEILVVGGGPAGLCAAAQAAKLGVSVLVIDENVRPGGQLFKQIHKFFGSKDHFAGVRGIDIGHHLLQQCKRSGVRLWLNAIGWSVFPDENSLAVLKNGKISLVKYEKIILATGASENPIEFPGWTLPGVMGAGAAQTMINIYRVLPGKKVLMVGSGNVGLIVSYQLLQAGAQVVAVVEAAPNIGGYGVHASKIIRAGVPILVSHTIKEARGKKGVEEAIVAKVDEQWNLLAGTEREIKVDLICIAAGLSPLAELAWMMNCEFSYISALGGFIPLHNGTMQSTRPEVYVAGDIAGIEEASTAMEEGRLAGLAASQELGYIRQSEANQLEMEIKERLESFRIGPFGEDRKKAKAEIMRRWWEKCKKG